MNGVRHGGKWYPSTGYLCRRCGSPVFESDLKYHGYSFQCFVCDEDMFRFEVIKAPADEPRAPREEV
jgi:uncharacterized Zn finger protein (UPF0148 family)